VTRPRPDGPADRGARAGHDDDLGFFDDDAADDLDDGHDERTGDRHGDGFDDPRVQAGVEHLQRAAHEVIAASRALLDVAEDLVDDPRSVPSVLGLLGSLGDLAAGRGRPGPRTARADDRPDDDPPVQRIPVS
jgi:hypothetical protein